MYLLKHENIQGVLNFMEDEEMTMQDCEKAKMT